MHADKRWSDGRQLWVVPPVVFTPNGYAVDVAREADARAFVERHHYSHSFPAARLCVGLYGPGPTLVGVAVFSVPMNQRVIPKWTGQAPEHGAELGRFVCEPSVRFNGESWFLARAFRLVRQEKGIRAIVSYADPLEHATATGEVVKPAHWGTIYQASNAVYGGRAEPRTLLLTDRGDVISQRALAKIRAQTKGKEYAAKQLIAAGAPAREHGESPAEWVARAVAGFRRVRHPGNHTYLFGLTDKATAELRQHTTPLSYPRRAA